MKIATEVKGSDLPIVKLIPRQMREIAKSEQTRLAASIRSVGLIEPLVVFPENGDYVILDGYQRYRILLEMGVEKVPCLLWNEKEAFTGNRMVNRLSPSQEMRMLRKSLEELDEKTIATAFGVVSIGYPGKTHPFLNEESAMAALTDRIMKKGVPPLVVLACENQYLARCLTRRFGKFRAAVDEALRLLREGAQRSARADKPSVLEE